MKRALPSWLGMRRTNCRRRPKAGIDRGFWPPALVMSLLSSSTHHGYRLESQRFPLSGDPMGVTDGKLPHDLVICCPGFGHGG
jgi:hypothetical protein